METYDEISIALSNAFDDISAQVRSFSRAVRAHPQSAYINYHIAMFYFDLFDFLISIMTKWYKSPLKRALNSLGDTFIKTTIKKPLARMKEYTERIQGEEQQNFQEVVMKNLFYLSENVKTCLTNLEVLTKDIADLKPMKDHKVPRRINVFARTSISQLTPIENSLDSPRSLISASPRLDAWSKQTIEQEVQNLKSYIQDPEKVEQLIELAHSIFVTLDVLNRIQDWISNTFSEALWIEGPYDSPSPSQNSLTSAFILSNLNRLRIPTLTYFFPYDSSEWDSFDCQTEVLRLVYSIIWQAVSALPEDTMSTTSSVDFSAFRMRKACGDETLSDSIKLLIDLVKSGPPLIFCVIDGLQRLDDSKLGSKLQEGLRELLQELCNLATEGPGKGKVFKVLFTTDGFTDELTSLEDSGLLSRETYDDEEGYEPIHLTTDNLSQLNV
jgi:hypothetical protein